MGDPADVAAKLVSSVEAHMDAFVALSRVCEHAAWDMLRQNLAPLLGHSSRVEFPPLRVNAAHLFQS